MPTGYAIYQIDAFTGELFRGNPAAVVILDHWLPDGVLQAIAAENNLSETAYVIIGPSACELRWFTPMQEVDLCGHATLAAARVLLGHGYVEGEAVAFATRSGTMRVTREDELYCLDFPARPGEVVDPPAAVAELFGAAPVAARQSRDLMLVFDDPGLVRRLEPDFTRIAALEASSVIVTAPANDGCDFVSRFFAPRLGVAEDPVTGSAHCTLVPYWAQRLGRTRLTARQVSPRGGELICEDRGERVMIAGRAVQYLQGTITA